MKLPRNYVSWSQLRVWLDDKEKYRRRYYMGIEEPRSKYLLFGSEVAKGLEDKTIVLPNLVQLPVQEYQVKVDIEGVPVFGYIDQYDPETHGFREVKTGVMRPDGKPRWTGEDVKNHGQLDLYSLIIEEKHGHVDETTFLDWIVTRPKKRFVEFDGHMLEAEGREMEMTGEVVSFKRVITRNERERMRLLIRSVADEISADYAAWLKAANSRELLGGR